MLVERKSSDDPTVIGFTASTDLPSRLMRRLREYQITRSLSRYRHSRPDGYERFSDDRSAYGASLGSQVPACDVVNLRSITGFFGYDAIRTLADHQIPVVWTLDDMNPLTGGCHFDDCCGRFREECGSCPQLGSADPNDLSHRVWRRKLDVLSHINPSRLHIVATNRWMEDMVKRSSLLNRFPLTVIPYGLDTDVFLPRSKEAARLLLGLPQDALVILFVAYAVNLRRKGLALLTQALTEPTIGDKVYLVSTGNGLPSLRTHLRNQHLGNIKNDWALSCLYSAADIFVCPSMQDNFPNTVLEAMACGTPVVAFEAGGISDMVRPAITGLLASVGDTEGLRSAIMSLLQDRTKRAAMGANSRSIALQEYSLEIQARRYMELYNTMLFEQSCNN